MMESSKGYGNSMGLFDDIIGVAGSFKEVANDLASVKDDLVSSTSQALREGIAPVETLSDDLKQSVDGIKSSVDGSGTDSE